MLPEGPKWPERLSPVWCLPGNTALHKAGGLGQPHNGISWEKDPKSTPRATPVWRTSQSMESQLGKALSDQWVQPFPSSAKATPGPGPKGKQPLSDLQSTGIVLKITSESRSQNLNSQTNGITEP